MVARIDRAGRRWRNPPVRGRTRSLCLRNGDYVARRQFRRGPSRRKPWQFVAPLPIRVPDYTVAADRGARKNLEARSTPEVIGTTEPRLVVGKTGRQSLIHNYDGAIDGRFEARIHDDIRAELLGTPGGPRIEINADTRNLPDRCYRTDN